MSSCLYIDAPLRDSYAKKKGVVGGDRWEIPAGIDGGIILHESSVCPSLE